MIEALAEEDDKAAYRVEAGEEAAVETRLDTRRL